MSFSDKDLKQLKERGAFAGGDSLFAPLIARLEAAEKVVQLNLAEHHTCPHKSPCIFIKKIEAWRKSKGEDSATPHEEERG